MGAVCAPAGTVATITESDGIVNPASAGPKRTDDANAKCDPFTVTGAPGLPPGGEKPRITGSGPGTACQFAALRVSAAVSTGSYPSAGVCNNWICDKTRPTGVPQPAQLPVPVVLEVERSSLNA